MPCNCCQITNDTFGEERARIEIREYHKRGPAKHTQLILDAVRSLGLKDAELLDVGGGVGAIYHELMGNTAKQAVHVDASSAYLRAAKEEAARRGHADRVQFIHADFTDVAAELPEADVVTLDRVVCCYPNFHGLLTAAAVHGRRALAMTYPREVWYTRFGMGVMNFFQRLRKDPFRVFVHPVDEFEALLKSHGFVKIAVRRLMVWEMALYRKA